MNNTLKILALIISVIVLVCGFLYFVDGSLDSPSDYSESESSYSSSGFLETLNTIPDFDEQERIEKLTGLNSVMYIFYLLLILLNISFIWIIKQDESSSKIIVYGIYASLSLITFINLLLLANHNSWSLNHAFRLTLNGVGTGFLASLISVCIYSVRNVFKILKEESKSLISLVFDRMLSPNIYTSLVISRIWIFFTLLISLFFLGLFLV